MKVIIPLAGRGTRLRPHTHPTPKPMLKVAGKPVMAYVMADQWLKGFEYKSPMNPMIFIISIAGLLCVTLLTISYETWKAARVNPVKSLRTE